MVGGHDLVGSASFLANYHVCKYVCMCISTGKENALGKQEMFASLPLRWMYGWMGAQARGRGGGRFLSPHILSYPALDLLRLDACWAVCIVSGVVGYEGEGGRTYLK